MMLRQYTAFSATTFGAKAEGNHPNTTYKFRACMCEYQCIEMPWEADDEV